MTVAELDHERMRFAGMTRRELQTRLNRITKTDKLLNFSMVAKESGYADLSAQALRKFEQKTGHQIQQSPIIGRERRGSRNRGVSAIGLPTAEQIAVDKSMIEIEKRAAARRAIKKEKKIPKGIRVIR